jgi:hypothetical protein
MTLFLAIVGTLLFLAIVLAVLLFNPIGKGDDE